MFKNYRPFYVLIFIAIFILGYSVYHFSFETIRSKEGIENYFSTYVNNNSTALGRVINLAYPLKNNYSCFEIENNFGFDTLYFNVPIYDSLKQKTEFFRTYINFPVGIKADFNKTNIEKVFAQNGANYLRFYIMNPIRVDYHISLLYTNGEYPRFENIKELLANEGDNASDDWIYKINNNWYISANLLDPIEVNNLCNSISAAH